jgi:uncharacterized membrane protein
MENVEMKKLDWSFPMALVIMVGFVFGGVFSANHYHWWTYVTCYAVTWIVFVIRDEYRDYTYWKFRTHERHGK